MNYIKKLQFALPLGLLLLCAQGAFAQVDPAGEATTMVNTATTVFGLVAALSVTMIGFYLVMRVVKGIRK